ncbi:MAG: M20/M25/M40 family metallo-hydrolase [Deltaproteobacteria bacterium]|nr:M20/M25/M40 family metallo-hydrolase [Deltaproteobacteria bacterium]
MRPFSLFPLLFVSIPVVSQDTQEGQVIISVGSDAIPALAGYFANDEALLVREKNVSILRVPEKELPFLSHLMHEKFGRCGGFFVEDSFQTALSAMRERFVSNDEAYTIDQAERVKEAIGLVREEKIRGTIEALSAFRNRYYHSPHGVQSQEFVGKTWLELASSLPNVRLEYFEHAAYPQRSVILTIPGVKTPEEVIVIGGHGDSIAGWNPPQDVEAPGADDNASGISTITEVIRVLSALNFAPDRTIKFMSYAAEEVGLRGSNEIATQFEQSGVQVKGVIQLDMTNFTTRPKEIVIMTDFTDPRQNQFMKNLLSTYLPTFTVLEDRCGYACSDHASWHRHGFPASIPFESRMREYNPNIHTKRDTISVSNNRAEHAVPFAQLVLAYAIELLTL